jgi:hypothetical protein
VNCKTIKEWEDLDAIVFETRAMKCLIKRIEEEDIVTVQNNIDIHLPES